MTVVARIKARVECGEHPEAATCMRKTKALSAAINREKILGCVGNEPAPGEEIKTSLLDHYKKTSTGGIFLRHCKYIRENDPIKELVMICVADHGAWVMGRGGDIFMDGTFDTRPPNFGQIYSTSSEPRWLVSSVFRWRMFSSQTKRQPPTKRCGS
jgi:hypothetical protein